MVTGGEHEYTLAGFRRLIEERCVDIGTARYLPRGRPDGIEEDCRLC